MSFVAVRRSDSQAMSRKTGNSPRRLGATVASSCSTSKPGFYPQRPPHSTRQSLSRSYDSPEEIHRLSQVSTKKLGSPVLRRSASPPATSAVRKHNNASSGRNQTVLDDAVWMNERTQNLQKTGIFQYPSMSKLRNSAHISSSGQYLSAASVEDYEERSCFSSSPIHSSNSLQSKTAVTLADEPLSAFRLSEVTLGDEDLLTDFNSTCNSTPVSQQSGHMFDRTAGDYYQGTFCLYNRQQIDSGTQHKNLEASSKHSLLNIRGDLLHRLEALQHRAELAEKASHPNKIDFDQTSKDPWHGHVYQDSLSLIHSQNVMSQQSGVLSAAASPTHSTFESSSWQREGQEKSSDSTFWPHKEVETQPDVSHLMYSSSRVIRPEYYLPLSKEEPAHKDMAVCLSSSRSERKSSLKDENLKRCALQRSSALCQHRSEDIRPGKCSISHKQIHPTRKSRRSLERSMDSVYRSVPARGATSVPGFSLSEPCSTAARTAAREGCSIKSKSCQSSFCAGYKKYTNLKQEDKSLVFSKEVYGQIQNKLNSAADYDGEFSWISEENVESFLRSRCLVVDHVDVMNAPPQFSDTNGDTITDATVSLLVGKNCVQSTDTKLHCYEQSLSSPSASRNECSQVRLTECNKANMEESSTFDKCQELSYVSEGSSTINSQTSSHSLDFLAYSHSSLPKLYDTQNLLHKPEGQVCHTEEGMLPDTDSLLCCKTILDNEHTNESQAYAGTMEQPYIEGKHVSCTAPCCKGHKGASETQIATLETQQQMQITKLARPFCLERSRLGNSTTSITKEFSLVNASMPSPEIHLMERQHWPVVAKMCEKASLSQGLSERVTLPLDSEHRNSTKIARSLSFHDKGTCKIEANQSTCDDLSELKSTSFSHYWIRNNAYPLDVSELLNSVTKVCRKPGEANTGKIVQGSKLPETSSSMEQVLLKEVPGIVGMDKEHGGSFTTLWSPSKSCKSASEIKTGEVIATELKSSQQCCPLQFMDNSAGTVSRLQDDFMVDKVVKDEDCRQQLLVSKVVPKDAGNSKCFDMIILQETLSKGKDVGTGVCSSYKCEPKQVEGEKHEDLKFPEQHVSKTSSSYHSNLLFLECSKDSSKLEIPCSPCLQDSETLLSEQVMKTPSILSVYKNPLWLDENSTDFENRHTLQDEEFLDLMYCSKRSKGFLDSDKSRLSSERFENKTWDTYEGMGAFISSPDSPYGIIREKVSEAKDKFLNLVHCSDLDSLWDVQSQIKKKLRDSSTEVENDKAAVCRTRVLESRLASKDLMSCILSGFNPQDKGTASDQADQQQLLTSHPQVTLKPDLTSHIVPTSSPVKLLSIADDNYNSLCLSSAPLLCSEQCEQLMDTLTTNTNVSSHGAKTSLSLVNCSSKQVLLADSSCLISENAMIQDVALLACKTREHQLLYSAPSTDITDETVNCDRKEERSSQEHCASTKARGGSSISVVEHLHPPDSELSSVNATNKNLSSKDPIILSNDEMQANEQVKRVTFVYPSSKEPLHTNANAAFPDMPLDSSSTWVLSMFSSATEGQGNLKKGEQKQLLKQDKSQKNHTELNRLGEKVESLEEEIDKFKQENKKLQNLVKCMVRKMKQLQQGFRGKKTRGASRGFMTCLCLVRVQRRRCKLNILRPSF
ncbi:hypothetical protein L7F22_022747 [Adiantum nelumboides]|nr:hypothetical protein [Adiantum nelumboides]